MADQPEPLVWSERAVLQKQLYVDSVHWACVLRV
jgi:hypothetical protein